MKLSNEKRKFYFHSVNTLFVLALLFLGFGLFITFGPIRMKLLLISIGVILLYFTHLWRGNPFFQYDSEGETLNFTNRNFYMLFGDPKVVKRAEFPKRKLLGYKISKNPLKRRLVLIVRSKRTENERSKQVFDITYLNKSERKDLMRSLDKVMKRNKQSTE